MRSIWLRRLITGALITTWLAAATGCGAAPPPPPAGSSSAKAEGAATQRVREPAVAGLFYPKEPAALSAMIDALLKAAPARPNLRPRALICPHAGYPYSGQTAAHAYKLIASGDYRSVIVLAPSHYAAFSGASVSAADVFRTPLGDLPVDRALAAQLLKHPPFVPERSCPVQRPQWAAQSSRPLPPRGEDTPDTWEHSDEVQVPFLQRALPKARVLTVVIGDADPAALARALASLVDDRTLVIASSDLSHYHPYDAARKLDDSCVKAICALDLGSMENQEACGKSPILAVMNLAKLKGWTAQLLDARNSGDTSGDKDRGVVGYAAVAFSPPEKTGYTVEDKKFLMGLARQTVREVVNHGKPPRPEEKNLSPVLTEPKGCFVTLTKEGRLRGCIGHILPMEPLYLAIVDNATSAALRDTRFSPVEPDEIPRLQFEISILTEPQILPFGTPDELLQKLRPHVDGVVLQIGSRRSTFLPQVWEQIPDKVDFLNHLATKAGCAADDWRNPGTTVSIYQVESFKESDL